MTLITVAANFAFVVQVADRRLTGSTGPLPAEQTKAIHFHLPNADLLVGYTGLAAAGSNPMNRLLMEVLAESARQGSFELLPTAEAITANLNKLFQRRLLRMYQPQDRRLSLMMTGFHRLHDDRHTIVQGLWTNFQDWSVQDAPVAWDEFVFTPLSVKAGESWPTLVQRIGAYDAIPQDVVERELRPLLAPGRPPAAVRDKVLRALPAQSALHPTVGVNANAAILLSNGGVEWTYWTGAPSWMHSTGNTVLATPEQDLMVADFEMYAVDAEGNPAQIGPPMVVPQVPRNRPCPCGSRKRYRQCHGRRP